MALPPLAPDDGRLVTMGDAVAFVTYPTCGAVFTDEGAVLIDGPMDLATATQWRAYVTARAPIRYHVLSEHHEDHTACSSMLGSDILLASEITARELGVTAARDDGEMRETLAGWGRNGFFDARSTAAYHFRAPDLTFGDRIAFTLGDKRFVVFRAPGHTQGSSILHAVDDRVAFVADNVFPWRCAPPAQSADPWAWLKTLGVLEALDVDWYVPGHSDPIRREGIHEQRIGLLHMIDCVRGWKRDGWSRERVMAEGQCAPLGPRPAHRGFADTPPGLVKVAEVIAREGLGRIYDCLNDHPSGALRPNFDDYQDYNAAFAAC